MTIEFREPYPIHRGFRVPVWEDGGPKNVRRLTDGDRRAFEEALNMLKSLIRSTTRNIQDEEERMERIADLMVIFFKAPLVQEVSPVAPTPLKAYALSILLPSIFRKEPIDLYRFADLLSELKPNQLDSVRVIFEPETADLVLRIWLAFPADTRPGYNTSSLISHLFLTSAIAWALEHLNSRHRRNVIRLAALFHDLGKAVDPEKHYEASEELARLLLRDVLSDQIINEIANAVREHHIVESSLSKADRLASAADRLDRLVGRTIGQKLERIKEILGSCRDEWELWRRAYEEVDKLRSANLIKEDPIRELTEEFLDQKAGIEELEEKRIEGISLVLIDVASIQEFVYRSQEIRAVAAASHLIDLAVHAHFLNYLHASGVNIPPEAVIYSGGGNILMILPDDVAGKVEVLAERYSRENGISLSAAKTGLSDSYVLTSRRLSEEMARKKLILEPGDSLETHESEKNELCEMCYSDWATELLPDGKKVCKLCERLYNLGSKAHFGPKWSSELRVLGDVFSAAGIFGKEWDKVSGRIIEIIAGHEPDELERLGGEVRYRDYAVIKFDGNMMGSFMMEAISFTDAIERSFRVDMALKKAYFRALEILYKGVRSFGEDEARKTTSRLFLGTIYMGGDDGLILAPAWAAVPLAHFIAEEFARQLGLSRGLTVAVAAGPAKMSIWSLLDCASRMMERAKDVARSMGLSAIVFDLFESGSPSGASSEERLRRFSMRFGRNWDDNVDSMQPYLISRSDLEGKTIPEIWNTLFPLVLDVSYEGEWSDVKSAEMHEIALKKAFMISRSKGSRWNNVKEVQDLQKLVGEVRNVVMRSWNAVAGSKYWREKLYIYAHRQWQDRESLSEPTRIAYERLIRLIERTAFDEKGNLLRDKGAVPLVDILTLLKLARGGAW